MGNHQKKLLDILQKLEYHTLHKSQAASTQPVIVGCRSTVGLPTLDRPIGVRIPAPQPWRGEEPLHFCYHATTLIEWNNSECHNVSPPGIVPTPTTSS